MLIVLRASGAAFDVDACLVWIPPARLERVWRIGEPRLVGSTYNTNGLTLKLGESERAHEAIEDAQRTLRALPADIHRLLRASEHAVVDVALFVTDAGSSSVTVPSDFLALLSEIGLVLKVTAYPCADDCS